MYKGDPNILSSSCLDLQSLLWAIDGFLRHLRSLRAPTIYLNPLAFHNHHPRPRLSLHYHRRRAQLLQHSALPLFKGLQVL